MIYSICTYKKEKKNPDKRGAKHIVLFDGCHSYNSFKKGGISYVWLP
jgi:hypothetical protein